MAPASVDAVSSGPTKNKIIKCILCKKCKRNVRNGILCDFCDYWHHFNCGNVDKENLMPDQSIEWKCPSCVGGAGNMASSDQVCSVDEATFSAIVSELKLENENLLKEIVALKYQATQSDHELCKVLEKNCNLGHSETRPRPMSNSNWSTVKSKTSTRNHQLRYLGSDFPPLQNRYSVLQTAEDEPTENTRPNLKDFNLSEHETVKHGPRPTKQSRGQHGQTTQNKRPINIRCFSDSQGRNVAQEILSKSSHNVFSVLKPGAKFSEAVEGCEKVCKDLQEDDLAVFIAGTNDVARNESDQLLRVMKRKLIELRHTRVLVCSVPKRYDLPQWSCVNKEVDRVNELLSRLCSKTSNVSYLDLSSLGSRFHTSHGLHLNNLGKCYIANKILSVASEFESRTKSILEPIPLNFRENEEGFLV